MKTLVVPPQILLIGNAAVGDQVRAALAEPYCGSFGVERASRLADGLKYLCKKEVSAVLLELSLPDSEGIDTFDKVFTAAAHTPIVILGNKANEALAKRAVERGAHDYLLATHIDGYSLPRALRNAIEQQAIEDASYADKERALVTLNSIGDAVLYTDIAGNVAYLNLVAETMTGWRREEAVGQPLAKVFRIIDGTTRKTASDPLEMAVERNRTVGLTTNCILIRRDGFESVIEDSASPIYDRAGRVIGVVIVFHDVSTARAISLQMTYTAQHDLVTNLPNRLLFNDRVSQSVALARRQKRSIAVLFLDLDRFKYINDSLGHATGDKLLQSISQRLLATIRGSDTVSRQGGDEFVILLSDIACPEDAAASAKKILLSVSAPHSIGGQDLLIDCSIGISVYPADGEDAEALIKNADTAMYHAKENGRNNFQFFKPEMNLKAMKRQSLEGSLRRALEREEFLLHYQPTVNLETGKITGVEALIRWLHPDRGLILPSQFMLVAEECGLIVPIGRWALREACRQARAWHDHGLAFRRVSVNVSAAEFRHKHFVESVRTILSEAGLAARYLDLEFTEDVLMKGAEYTASVLPQLKAAGVYLAVDDFGSGYSNLSYFRQFPIDILKIDRSFVRQISGETNDSAIISAIIDLGKNLRHLVIAEGIETQAQLAFLEARQCAEGQGHLFSEPVSADQCTDLLQIGTLEIRDEAVRSKTNSRNDCRRPNHNSI